MKKIIFIISSAIAVCLLSVDYMMKCQTIEFPETYYTIFLVIFFAFVIKFMVEVNMAYAKRGNGVIFRPPFLKAEYFEDDVKYQWKRIAVYAVFGVIVGLLFYLTRSNFQLVISQIVEILAIATSFFALVFGMFENFVKRYLQIDIKK